MGFDDRVHRLKPVIDQVGMEYFQAAAWLPFQAAQIKEVFRADELDELEAFVSDMQSATSDNQRATKLVQNVTQYANVAVKLLKLAKIVV